MFNSLRVLIVDDHLIMRGLLKKSLQSLGVTQIDEAIDGVNALEKISGRYKDGQFYDIVFVDWNMPRLNGKELVEKCKTDEYYSEIPFIMVTAEREQSRVVEALQAGASDYIVKPFSPETLSKKLKRVLMKQAS